MSLVWAVALIPALGPVSFSRPLWDLWVDRSELELSGS